MRPRSTVSVPLDRSTKFFRALSTKSVTSYVCGSAISCQKFSYSQLIWKGEVDRLCLFTFVSPSSLRCCCRERREYFSSLILYSPTNFHHCLQMRMQRPHQKHQSIRSALRSGVNSGVHSDLPEWSRSSTPEILLE